MILKNLIDLLTEQVKVVGENAEVFIDHKTFPLPQDIEEVVYGYSFETNNKCVYIYVSQKKPGTRTFTGFSELALVENNTT